MRHDCAAAGNGREPTPEIGQLAGLNCEADVTAQLLKVASVYGQVKSILSLSTLPRDGGPQQVYLIYFERTVDAMAASRALRCLHFGFSSIMVPIPPNPATPDIPAIGLPIRSQAAATFVAEDRCA